MTSTLSFLLSSFFIGGSGLGIGVTTAGFGSGFGVTTTGGPGAGFGFTTTGFGTTTGFSCTGATYPGGLTTNNPFALFISSVIFDSYQVLS
jgi:hypothetical protein